jgi:phosphoesterase RecJ-like protein
MLILTQEKIHSLQAMLEAASKVVVLGHVHPDGDALGSTTGMALFLKQKWGKEVACILPDTPPENLHFILAPAIPYLFNDQQAQAAAEAIRKADLVILQDCNAFDRTEGLEEPLKASSARKILIDHHLNPDTEAFDLVFSTPDISSTCELLYWILKELGWEPDVAVGSPLLAGMTTDTNNFANSVYPSTFRMASELLAAGVDRDAILEKIYWCYRDTRVRLMGYMQNEGLHILPDGAAYMILTKDIQQRFGLREGETEGLVNVPLSVENVRLSLLAKEDQGHFRVSVRSKRGTSAQNLARKYFHGGGHENAAGGKILPEDYSPALGIQAYVERILKAFMK